MQKMTETKKIHLGCGEKRLPNFINIDARETEYTDLVCDITKLPFEENSIDLIYMCHSLEHIPMLEVSDFLGSLRNILKPNGEVYISVPDFSILSSLYLSGRVQLASIVRAIHGGQEYPGNTHYLSYDQEFLTAILRGTGFNKIKTYLPEHFLPNGFTDTSTYEIGNKRISLNVCASK